jgi:hypothetical protein
MEATTILTRGEHDVAEFMPDQEGALEVRSAILVEDAPGLAVERSSASLELRISFLQRVHIQAATCGLPKRKRQRSGRIAAGRDVRTVQAFCFPASGLGSVHRSVRQCLQPRLLFRRQL